jgi:hypothetical protein
MEFDSQQRRSSLSPTLSALKRLTAKRCESATTANMLAGLQADIGLGSFTVHGHFDIGKKVRVIIVAFECYKGHRNWSASFISLL